MHFKNAGAIIATVPNEQVGVDDAGGPPVPIPNTEVKPCSAEDSALATGWENRKMPTHKSSRPVGRLFFLWFQWLDRITQSLRSPSGLWQSHKEGLLMLIIENGISDSGDRKASKEPCNDSYYAGGASPFPVTDSKLTTRNLRLTTDRFRLFCRIRKISFG